MPDLMETEFKRDVVAPIQVHRLTVKRTLGSWLGRNPVVLLQLEDHPEVAFALGELRELQDAIDEAIRQLQTPEASHG